MQARHEEDTWGRDPNVRAMRVVFGAMGNAGAEFLKRAGVDDLDPRLSRWRSRARDLFEAGWPRMMARGLCKKASEAGAFYAFCLLKAMEEAAPAGAEEMLPGPQGVISAAREVLP